MSFRVSNLPVSPLNDSGQGISGERASPGGMPDAAPCRGKGTTPPGGASIPVDAPATRVLVVTAPPKDSYRIVDTGPGTKTSHLDVKDAGSFWRGERYLVVMTD